MAVNPAKRFRSADAFGRALRRYLRASRDETALASAREERREVPANPYKGLEAYTEADAHLFFGRDEQIERLWHAFRDLHAEQAIQSEIPRVLPIVGPSGCGKWSLTRAGLIAELRRTFAELASADREQRALAEAHEMLELLEATVTTRFSTGQQGALDVLEAQLEIPLVTQPGEHRYSKKV